MQAPSSDPSTSPPAKPRDTHVASARFWHRFLLRPSLPVFAFGARGLYSVVVEGFGLTLPVSFHPSPICGFYLSVNVAAVSVRAAQDAALSIAARTWRRKGYESLSGGAPQLRIDHIRRLPERFRSWSVSGFIFHHEPNPPREQGAA